MHDNDWVDAIVISDLKHVYRENSKLNKIDNSNDYIDPDWDFLAAVEKVLRYYMTDIEYNDWIKENESKHWSL
jgi:hypothetical protein